MVDSGYDDSTAGSTDASMPSSAARVAYDESYVSKVLQYVAQVKASTVTVSTMISEFIEGSDADCSFIAVGGELVVSTTQKSNTPDSANFQASGNVHVGEVPDLTEAARNLVRSLNFTGIANADFRLGTDGKPYLLEINARIWASLLASVAAGVNFPDILCRLALDLPVHVPECRSIHFSTLGLGLRRTLRHPFRAAGSTPSYPLTELGFAMSDPLPEIRSRLRALTRGMRFHPAR
jgi:biotin carboxylase